MNSEQGFEGIPKDGFQFLKRLKKNNRRNWFKPRKSEFELLLLKPIQHLTAELGKKLGREFPELTFDPKRSVYRIYRDVRFSDDKSPYKTHVAASFGQRGQRVEYDRPGLYFHVEPGEVVVAGGLYMPNSLQLRLIRSSILDHPEEYLKVVNDRKFKKRFGGIEGEKLKRAPQGMDPNHPLMEHLRNKQFFVSAVYPEALAYHSKKLLPQLLADYQLMQPLMNWLNKALRPMRQQSMSMVRESDF